MFKKVLLIAVPVLIVALMATVVVVPPLFKHSATIETRAVGVWQEKGASPASSPAYRLTIERAAGGANGAGFSVTYTRTSKAAFPAVLAGDELHVWGENSTDVVWVIDYNARTDTLLVTRPGGRDLHGLRRVSN
jgi:hypothetical protein